MLSIRLSDDMQKRIDALSEATQRPKSFFVKEALKNYLEDMEDYYEVLKRKSDKNLISLEELKSALEV